MKAFFKWLLPLCLLPALLTGAAAQDKNTKGVPRELYYLMPSFGNGFVYFSGMAPAQGKLNICAVDHSLRFLDESGEEVVAVPDERITKVQIDGVFFIRDNGYYLRMYPVTQNLGVAFKRVVELLTDTKRGAYGTVSRTSSSQEYGTIYSEGRAIMLEDAMEYPYDVSESLYLYKGDDVLVLSKRNLRRLFPDRKDEIEAKFKNASSLPETVDDLLALLKSWTEQ